MNSGRIKTTTIVLAIGLAIPFVLDERSAFAQQPAAPAGGAAPGGGGSAAPGGGTTTTTTTTQSSSNTTTFFPGGVAPPPPGGVLGGGNAQFSSSKPITGNERDGFDFRAGGGGGGTVRGNENSSFIVGGGNAQGAGYSGVIPNVHNVHRGDTLWGICGYYFHNPYQWPRIWSFNPQIQNPHWIYPGDQVKLRSGNEVVASPQAPTRGTILDRRRQVPPDTVFLRNEGFIEDDSNDWGEINGAREDKMFLTDYDEVYIRVAGNHEIKVGQELTVYRPIKSVGGGKLIEIQGTVKVDQWNPNEHVARARVTEALDTIERGARVGPISRRFEVVPPARNDKDVEATVLTSVRPHAFYGQNQVVFIDKGEEAGLRPGNRLFIIRKGDGFHATQPTRTAAQRIALEDESPAAMESITKPRNEGALPEEVIAELRVINVKKNTAMTLVTLSRREVEIGERAYARKGY
ncbi:MAG: LysM peptidoglycan-binding domain-containing protein [Labilithrix sp.]|nr:LysM peptidoglycan-binding domain-containing protein [Labilithrix sp.]MCW5817847.1 LysM peptidoglycan-binding domain-containing protein [Labilithrix sp.]